MKLRVLLTLLLMLPTAIKAQDVKFTASAPSAVVANKPFQLVYVVNSNKAKDLRPPDFSGFELLAEPYQSVRTNISSVNGNTTSSVEVTFTYTLMAGKEGDYKLSPASITVNGEKVVSNGLSIKVLPPDSNGDASANQRSSQSEQGISPESIFVRAIPSKSSVYEQEGLVVTYKLYTLVDVIRYQAHKMPDFRGFLKQDIEQNGNRQMEYEKYNGKNYATVVLYQVLLYPQRAGEAPIDKATFELFMRIQNRSNRRSIFDDFFDSYQNVSKMLDAPAVRIEVKPLPEGKPAGFTGIVGRFSMNSTASAKEINVNDAVTIKVNITGNGNMKLIKTPEIRFPDGFEVLDPNVSNNYKTTIDGVTGTKSIEYVFIPRHAGNFEIPAAEFSYFDQQEKTFKTLRTSAYSLKVLKTDGADNSTVVGGNYVNKEDVKQLANDIRYIESGDFRLSKTKSLIITGIWGWLSYLLALLAAAILFVAFRKNLRDHADAGLVKNKRANKVARKRLKLAEKLLEQGNKDRFYDEVIKAVWNYLSHKLNMEAALLTKENVREELTAGGVGDEIIAKLLDILNTCEFARYAPAGGQQQMGNLYGETAETLGILENTINKK
jgi:hypothetical protein